MKDTLKSGFLLIDKEKWITTNSINNYIKNKFNVNKIGHLGTLDPFASGLIIYGVNEATKFFPLIEAHKKEYVAKMVL